MSRFSQKLLHPEKVSDLMAIHGDKVTQVLVLALKQVKVRPELEEAAKRAPLDELYALRFLLSTRNGNVEVAVKNLIETLEWRSKRLDALDDAGKGIIKNSHIAKKYSYIGIIGFLGDLHPIFVVRAGRTNTRGMLSELSLDEMVEGQLLQNEQIFRLCDQKTRETGFLSKQIGIIDLEGFSIFNWDPRFGRVLGRASTLSATYYPQLLGKTVLMNMPFAFRVLFKAMTPFMPASTLEKQTLCPGNTLKKSASECPFLKKFSNSVELLPPFLGGKAPLMPDFVLNEDRH